MPIIIHRIAAPPIGIASVHIVHQTVPIIIHSVAGDFIRVPPHVSRQILVGVTEAGIHHRYNHVPSRTPDIPTLRSIYIRIRNLVQPPECPIHIFWVIGCQHGLPDKIRFGHLHHAPLLI